jgi:hypothetical protein
MVHVMSGVQPDEVIDSFLAALDVPARVRMPRRID